MGNQLTSNAEALRLFFTEDIYLMQLAPEQKVEFKYLGKNQKNILILVNDQINEVSSEQGRELLRKLVKAIDLTANDFALVNYANYKDADYNMLSDFFKCQLVLAFGVSSADLGLPVEPLHQIMTHNNTRFIFTTNLHDLDADQVSKKTLWTSLQQLK